MARRAPVAAPQLFLRYHPDLYIDWERNRQHTIRWDSYDNAGLLPVRIDLMQDTSDGPRLVTTITPGTADNGHFDWIPSNSNIDFGTAACGFRFRSSVFRISPT